MKVEIIEMNPTVAEGLLKKNVANRHHKRVLVRELITSMQSGDWKENGESIIVDKNGFLKDGQHRCIATIEANHTWNVVLVTEVEPNVMDTIDVGVQRSLADILHIDGYQYPSRLAAMARRFLAYEKGKLWDNGGTRGLKYHVTNKMGRDYVVENYENMARMNKALDPIYIKQPGKVVTFSDMSLILHIIAGYDFETRHLDFMRGICGVETREDTASFWFYKKMVEFKKTKFPVSLKWRLGAAIRAWNMFVMGDEKVGQLKIRVSGQMEEPLSLDSVEMEQA